MKITAVIEKYLTFIATDEYHRYKSWDNCFKAFNKSTPSEFHSLELAFYLASWGMYRGSSGLLQKNHLIHTGAVDILFSIESKKLQCNKKYEVAINDIKEILGLKSKLAHHYRSFCFTKGSNKQKTISPTDTLLSKIMLGTLGCVPAYDRYFIEGLKEIGMTYTNFTELSLKELFGFIHTNAIEIEYAQTIIKEQTQTYYPKMKILDMFFWQIGFDKEVRDKEKGKEFNRFSSQISISI